MKTPKPPKPHPCDVLEQVKWIIQYEKTTWYVAYLKTDWWAFVRRRCMARAWNACERCQCRPARQVHHLTYERLGAERLDDVIAVCPQCHAEMHNTPRPADEYGRYGWQGMPEILYRVLSRSMKNAKALPAPIKQKRRNAAKVH